MKIKNIKTQYLVSVALTLLAINHAQAQSLVGINSNNQISVFDSANVSAASFYNINGLSTGESLLGIDLRPSNNTIYGISTANKLYTVDAYTGKAVFAFDLATAIASLGKGYGVDFNPVADRGTGPSLRVVSSSGDNYAVNVNNGAVTTATSIASGYSAVAYSNSDSTKTTAPANTQLYYINSDTDTLSVANSGFNNPTISLVGALGFDILKANGFEIFADGSAFSAVNMDDGSLDSQLLSINLSTGAASSLGKFSGTINGLTAAPSAVPVPAALPLMASALGLFGLSRRRQLLSNK